MPQGSPIRILLAEDHTIVRQGLRTLLEEYPNLAVVGEASNGEEAVFMAGKLQPAIVLMDITMPKMDGITATRLIKTNFPHIAVIGLTVNPYRYNIDAMHKAGASEVLSKENAVGDLFAAIQRSVASIQPILVLEDPSLSREVALGRGQINESPAATVPMKESSQT